MWKRSKSRQKVVSVTYRMPYGKSYAADGDAEYNIDDELDVPELAGQRNHELPQAKSLPKTWSASQTLITVKPGGVSINRELVTVADLYQEGQDYTPGKLLFCNVGDSTNDAFLFQKRIKAPVVHTLWQTIWSNSFRIAAVITPT